MTKSSRRSPLHDLLDREGPQWGERHGMLAAARLPRDDAIAAIMLADASCLPRMGVKGPNAEGWLRSRQVSLPEAPNTWTRTAEGVLVARLARSEFLLEDEPDADTVERWRHALEPAPGLYPVLRQDAALALAGERLHDLLVQTCNVNFKACAAQTVIMTSMAGVPVSVLWDESQGGAVMRIWCDGTYGPYLWETLLEIARVEGGGAVGFDKLFPGGPPG